jgi:hypothetical protein
MIEEWDEVLACLERSDRERDPNMDGLIHLIIGPIRSDPRFDDLLRRVGFPKSRAVSLLEARDRARFFPAPPARYNSTLGLNAVADSSVDSNGD